MRREDIRTGVTCLQNQDGAKVVDVGAGRTAHHQIIERTEKSVTIVVVEHGARL